MGIFDRMGKVISSNVNALLDKAEDPKKSLDLIVEEMKEQLRAARKEIVEGLAAEKVLRKKVDDLDADSEKWDRRAELALKANDETLAREALVQKRRIVGERDRAEALRAEQRAAVLNMKAELERMEQKQSELEARKGTMAAQIRQAKAGGELSAVVAAQATAVYGVDTDAFATYWVTPGKLVRHLATSFDPNDNQILFGLPEYGPMVDLKLEDGSVYWANAGDPNTNTGQLWRMAVGDASADAGAAQLLRDKLPSPQAIAVDDACVYWVEKESNRLMRAAR
jgi:phage shock protein A